jgi:16S rRNA processing protein RimM
MTESLQSSQKSNLLQVAIITSAHGIKGEVKIFLQTEFANFKRYKKFFDKNGEVIDIASKRFVKGEAAVIKLSGVTDRNGAEMLKKTEIFIDKGDLEKSEEGEFYSYELIGLKVFENEKEVGEVVGVLDHGGGELLSLKFLNSKVEEFLFNGHVFPEIDLQKGRMVLVRPEMV